MQLCSWSDVPDYSSSIPSHAPPPSGLWDKRMFGLWSCTRGVLTVCDMYHATVGISSWAVVTLSFFGETLGLMLVNFDRCPLPLLWRYLHFHGSQPPPPLLVLYSTPQAGSVQVAIPCIGASVLSMPLLFPECRRGPPVVGNTGCLLPGLSFRRKRRLHRVTQLLPSARTWYCLLSSASTTLPNFPNRRG